jgi:hypothetical protein
MKAGFALAALLLDDRALAQVETALPPEQLPALRAELALTGGHDRGVADLLRVLQPELTLEGARQLPPRMRALLARLLPPSVRKALLADTPASFGMRADSRPSPRPDFVLDQHLLRALVRLARRPTGSVPG